MANTKTAVNIALAVATFALPLILSPAARAGDAVLYEIKSDDGYGISDCLSQGDDCGQFVADSWCDAHGLGKAVSYGYASRLSSSVGNFVSTDTDAYMVSCAR